MIRIIAIGDIVGKSGRRCLEGFLPRLRQTFSPSAIIINGENAAGGFGLTKKIYDRFTETLAIDAVTMGNHWHDKREIYNFADSAERLVLPANMANVSSEQKGLRIIRCGSDEIAVMNLAGQAFMYGENRCPFKAVDKLINLIPSHVKTRIVDIHAEASSEKQALAHYLSGRVSLVYGTHTHCPTGDERIIDNHTAFATDLGMTGSYDSVIGMKKDVAILRMTTGEKKKFEPATGPAWLCGLIVDIDESSGASTKVERIRWEES